MFEPGPRQRAHARRVAEARAVMPDAGLTAEVDMDACIGLRHSLSAIAARACALALRAVPRANAAYRDGRFELYSRVNIGVTVDIGDAELAPTLFDADRKSLAALDDELAKLEHRARAGELSPPELAGATFTLTNANDEAVAAITPILVPPQAAAIGAGAVREVAVVREGEVRAGRVMTLTLVCDGRILYGSHASAFLRHVKTALERAAL